MSKAKPKTQYSIAAKINVEVCVEIEADNLEQAIAVFEGMGNEDFIGKQPEIWNEQKPTLTALMAREF